MPWPKGRPFSPEHGAKISAALRARRAPGSPAQNAQDMVASGRSTKGRPLHPNTLAGARRPKTEASKAKQRETIGKLVAEGRWHT